MKWCLTCKKSICFWWRYVFLYKNEILYLIPAVSYASTADSLNDLTINESKAQDNQTVSKPYYNI